MSDVEEVTKVIGQHYGVVWLNGVWCCACGHCLADHKVDAKMLYDRHLAFMLVPVVQAARAEALEETADAMMVPDHDCFKPWCPHCSVRNEIAARQRWLRARAAAIRSQNTWKEG